jgi:hypothetical protein
MAKTYKHGNVTVHQLITEHESNRQFGVKLFEQLEKLFTANGVNTLDLRKAQEEFING